MAASTYNSLAQAQAAYNALQQQKTRAQRDANVMHQQDIQSISNYIKQNGVNGGAQESTMLRARSGLAGNMDTINSTYNPDLANLAAIIQSWNRGGGYGGGGTTSTKGSSKLYSAAGRSAMPDPNTKLPQLGTAQYVASHYPYVRQMTK